MRGCAACSASLCPWCLAAMDRIRYLNSTGTSVKDSTRLAISAMQTDSDNGENRYFAVP